MCTKQNGRVVLLNMGKIAPINIQQQLLSVYEDQTVDVCTGLQQWWTAMGITKQWKMDYNNSIFLTESGKKLAVAENLFHP